MVIPALGPQLLQKILDHLVSPRSFSILRTGTRCLPYDIIKMTHDKVEGTMPQ